MFPKKTDFQPKRWHLYFFVILMLAAGLIKLNSYRVPAVEVTIGNRSIRVLAADTPERRFRGLSGRKDLGRFDGMLFVFPTRGGHSMVMRDMLFPLDIVWIDGTTIVDMAQDLQPEPDRKETELTVYSARLPSTLVLELPAGFVGQNGLKLGDRVKISRD